MRTVTLHFAARPMSIAAILLATGVSMAVQPPAPDTTTKQPVPKDSDKKPESARDKLKAAADLYASAKTYRDTGEVKQELDAAHGPLVSSKPFSTAFERGGRFRWEFKGSAMPGGAPKDSYTVWSTDQKSFESYWSMNGQRQKADSLGMAMAGPTGISGGSATVVLPLLCPDMQWGIKTTDLTEPVDKGSEKLGDVECTKIQGKSFGDGDVTIWLDAKHAIRKVHMVQVIDPAKIPESGGRGEKFTARTTITITPVFDEKIDDAFFAPPQTK